MTDQEKKELDYVLKTAMQVALGIAVLFLGLLIITNLL